MTKPVTTVIEGKIANKSRAQIRRIARLLNLNEAKAVEWALNRCGLRIKTPSKFYPES